MTEPIDVESSVQEAEPIKPAQSQALTVRDAVGSLERTPDVKAPITAAQAKIDAVATLTAKAYERASELVLTPDEVKALQAEFPDDAFQPGAAGKEHLIYIEHAFLRDRLNSVFGPGAWALIPRSRWAEEFVSSNGKPASRVYVEAMLLVRGCFVAEAVGEMEYWKNNASQNYGDAVEGAKTAALRRCCKEFGIGLQAWKKDWCAGWWERKRSGQRQRSQPQATSSPPQQPTKPAPSAIPAAETFLPVVTVKMVSERSGTKRNGEPWTAFFVLMNDGVADLEAATFSKTIGGIAQTLADSGAPAEATIKPGNKAGSFELVRLLPQSEKEPIGVTP